MYEISIQNCKCIKKANIKLEEGALNIKYGFNGLGKSSIAQALEYRNSGMLKGLKPYNSDDMTVVSGHEFKNICVFNYRYIQKFAFLESKLPVKAYEVFMKNDEYDKLMSESTESYRELMRFLREDEAVLDVMKLILKIKQCIAFNKSGSIRRAGGQGEVLKGRGANFQDYEIFDRFKTYYENDDIRIDWITWRTKGENFCDSQTCPYCGEGFTNDYRKDRMRFSSFLKKSAMKKIEEYDTVLDFGVRNELINTLRVAEFKKYLGHKEKRTEIECCLEKLYTEADYLYNKLNSAIKLQPLNQRGMDKNDFGDAIGDLEVDENLLSEYFATETTLKMVRKYNQLIEQLAGDYASLFGLFKQGKKKMDCVIEDKQEAINDFLLLAGFPYKFEINQKDGKSAEALLIPVGLSKEDNIEDLKLNLSWGERNAFALVMFVFETLSNKPELVILDDPITSFDKSKKFAVIRRLFLGKEFSFRGVTTLLLTHDLQPIIDMLVCPLVTQRVDVQVNAMYLENNKGIVNEHLITKKDLINIIKVTEKISSDTNYLIGTRVINLRKYFEFTETDLDGHDGYQLLANLAHGRKVPKRKCKACDQQNGGFVDMAEDEIINGTESIKEYINDFNYGECYKQLDNNRLLSSLDSCSDYEKIVTIRLLFQKDENKEMKKQIKRCIPDAYKYANETAHIENDYIFQLNPLSYNVVPKYHLDQLIEFLKNNWRA